MKLKIVLGSVRKGRLGERVAKWVTSEIYKNKVEYELLDLLDYKMPFVDAEKVPFELNKKYPHEAVQRWSNKIDEGTAYTETNTLLEPNNFIPSWEDGGEENREVSTALRRLREDYDEIRRNALNKDAELEQIRADIKKARQEEKRVSKDFGGANIDTELSQKELEHLKKTHDF